MCRIEKKIINVKGEAKTLFKDQRKKIKKIIQITNEPYNHGYKRSYNN